MLKLVLLRHGQSIWNLENRFTGWTDVALSDENILGLNILTGIPLVYELDHKLRGETHYYLGEEEAIEKAKESAASQLSETLQTP